MMQRAQALWACFIGGFLIALSFVVRIAGYPLYTTDYTYFVKAWFDILKAAPGLTAFVHPFSDYAPLYLYFLKVLTFFPFYSLYSSKTLSVIGDIAIAIVAVLIARLFAKEKYSGGKQFFLFALMFSIPTVVINSSVWGQADSLYSAAIMGALYFILKDRPLWATVLFSIGLCFKLQAIFFLPIIAGYLLRKGKLNYGIYVPFIYFLSILPAWLSGGSLSDLLLVYLHQSSEYQWLSVSAQSLLIFFNSVPGVWQQVFFWLGLILALIAAIALMFTIYVVYKRVSAATFVFLSMYTVLIIPYLLPYMHERYFYLADILAVLYAFFAPRRWYIPVLVVGTSLISYMPFLSPQISWFSSMHIDLRVPSAILGITLIFLTRMLFTDLWTEMRDRVPILKVAAAVARGSFLKGRLKVRLKLRN